MKSIVDLHKIRVLYTVRPNSGGQNLRYCLEANFMDKVYDMMLIITYEGQ